MAHAERISDMAGTSLELHKRTIAGFTTMLRNVKIRLRKQRSRADLIENTKTCDNTTGDENIMSINMLLTVTDGIIA